MGTGPSEPRPPGDRPVGWRRGVRGLAVVALVLVAVLVGACGGGDDGSGSGLPLDAAAQRGRQVARDRGCTSCHTADGDNGTGPTWQGIWGRMVRLDGGRTAVVDRDYLVRSTRDPDADVVDGYAPLMPTFDLTDAEIDALVAYLEALAPHEAQ